MGSPRPLSPVVRLILVGAVGALVASACGSEDTTPIDLGPSTTVVGAPATAADGGPAIEDDPNAESRQMAIDFAEQQCFDDPEAEEGIIRIVEPESNQVVGEVVVDCEEVRSRPTTGGDELPSQEN